MKKSEIIAISVVTIILLTTAGCRIPGVLNLEGEPYSPVATDLPPQVTPDEMLLILYDRAPEIDNLWSRMKIQIRDKARGDKEYFRGVFLYTPPAKARLRGYKTAIPTTAFEILTVDERIYFHLNMDNELYSGTVDEWRRSPIIFSDIDLRNVGFILMPLQILRTALKNGSYTMAEGNKKFYECIVESDPSLQELAGTVRLLIRKSDLLVRTMEVYAGDNSLQAVVRYDRYDRYGYRALMPTELEIRLTGQKTLVRIWDPEYKINPDFSRQVFMPPEYPKLKHYPLRKIWEQQRD